jgi:hypothetical protein
VFLSVGLSQTAFRPSSMHVLPGTGQSEASAQGERHLPSAHARPMAQSLLSEHPVVFGAVELEQAGKTSATANIGAASHARARAPLDRSRPCFVRSIVCLPQ